MKRDHNVILSALFMILIFSGMMILSMSCKKQETPAGPKEKVNIGYSPEPSNALYMIAEAKGFFSREGLEAEIREYPSGKVAMEAMLKGEVDLSTPADPPVVFNSFERREFSIIASTSSVDRYHKIIARKDRGIQKPGDLRNKRIATQKASAVHYYLYLCLLNNGLTVKDVSLSFKQPDELPDLLSKGVIDAFSMREPYISRAKDLLGDNAIVFAEPEFYLRTDYLVGMNDLIKKRPELIKKVLRALIRAEEFAGNHPEQAIKIVSGKLNVRESEIKELWPDMMFRVHLEQTIVISLEGVARWAIQDSLTDKTQVPNYLGYIYSDGLSAVRPEAATIIK